MNFLFPVLLFFELFILKTVWKSDVEHSKILSLKKIIQRQVSLSLNRNKSGIFFSIYFMFCFNTFSEDFFLKT